MRHDGKETPACAVQGAAVPEDIECQACGEVYECWTDEVEPCPSCGTLNE